MPDNQLTPSLSEIASGLASLENQVSALAQQIEVQGAVQVEIAKLLQALHGQQNAMPDMMFKVVNKCLESDGKEKLSVLKETLTQLDTRMGMVTTGLHIVKQVSNMTLRELGSSSAKIRVLFIVQSIPMWDALADVYQAMTGDDRFEPMVVSINHSHLGRGEFMGETDVHDGLDRQGIPHLRMNLSSIEAMDMLHSLKPDVIFRQQQWDAPVPPALRTAEITFARICVVPYGMGVLANPDAKGDTDEAYQLNYDQPYHRAAWKVFCETEQTQAYYRSFQHSDPDKFILTGYPKLDKLLEAKGKGAWPIAEPDGRTFRVIWAPHHSLAMNGAGFGVFHKIYREMLDWAKSSADIQFVFKPHPALAFSGTTRLPTGEYDSFLQAWSTLPNCTICEGDYGALFDASDLMLTDGVSFLTEYHLFEKPLIFIDSGVHARFNALGRMAERSAHRVETFAQMKAAALEYQAGKPWHLEAEREELLNVLLPLKKSASQVILDCIADDIKRSGS